MKPDFSPYQDASGGIRRECMSNVVKLFPAPFDVWIDAVSSDTLGFVVRAPNFDAVIEEVDALGLYVIRYNSSLDAESAPMTFREAFEIITKSA